MALESLAQLAHRREMLNCSRALAISPRSIGPKGARENEANLLDRVTISWVARSEEALAVPLHPPPVRCAEAMATGSMRPSCTNIRISAPENLRDPGQGEQTAFAPVASDPSVRLASDCMRWSDTLLASSPK